MLDSLRTLRTVRNLPYPESLPLLTSPPGSAETVVPKGGASVGLFFFRFFPFFSVLEKTVKKRILQKSTFSGHFGDFGASDVDFRRFWVPRQVSGGSSGRVFRPFFPDAVLHRFFVVFSVKNVKLEKMKKCVSICKLHTILEVAPSKKIKRLRETTLSIQARFSVKNRAKIGPESDSKWQRQEKPTKSASGAVSGRPFSFPGSFLVDFGVPTGSPGRPRDQ